MPDALLSSKIDLIHELCLDLKKGREKITEVQIEQGKAISILTERSLHHEKRIDDVQDKCQDLGRKSGQKSGGLSGAVGGLLAGFISGFIGR